MSSGIYYEDYTWYIQIKTDIYADNKYNDTRYIEVDIDISQVEDLSEIFTLMEKRVPRGWKISDYENLYTLNDLNCDQIANTENPQCFETQSENEERNWEEVSLQYEKKDSGNYFDMIVETL